MKKIRDVVPMRNDPILAFQSFEAMIPFELVSQWRAAVELWEKDSNSPNPFEAEKRRKNGLPLSIPDNDLVFCSRFGAFSLAEAGGRG
jgi:hypothetical protein